LFTVSLAGSAACPAHCRRTLIGVIESMSAYLIGAVYKDIVSTRCFWLSLVQAQG